MIMDLHRAWIPFAVPAPRPDEAFSLAARWRLSTFVKFKDEKMFAKSCF